MDIKEHCLFVVQIMENLDLQHCFHVWRDFKTKKEKS